MFLFFYPSFKKNNDQLTELNKVLTSADIVSYDDADKAKQNEEIKHQEMIHFNNYKKNEKSNNCFTNFDMNLDKNIDDNPILKNNKFKTIFFYYLYSFNQLNNIKTKYKPYLNNQKQYYFSSILTIKDSSKLYRLLLFYPFNNYWITGMEKIYKTINCFILKNNFTGKKIYSLTIPIFKNLSKNILKKIDFSFYYFSQSISLTLNINSPKNKQVYNYFKTGIIKNRSISVTNKIIIITILKNLNNLKKNIFNIILDKVKNILKNIFNNNPIIINSNNNSRVIENLYNKIIITIFDKLFKNFAIKISSNCILRDGDSVNKIINKEFFNVKNLLLIKNLIKKSSNQTVSILIQTINIYYRFLKVFKKNFSDIKHSFLNNFWNISQFFNLNQSEFNNSNKSLFVIENSIFSSKKSDSKLKRNYFLKFYKKVFVKKRLNKKDKNNNFLNFSSSFTKQLWQLKIKKHNNQSLSWIYNKYWFNLSYKILFLKKKLIPLTKNLVSFNLKEIRKRFFFKNLLFNYINKKKSQLILIKTNVCFT